MTGIHPESYEHAYKLLEHLGFTSKDIGSEELIKAVNDVDREALAKEFNIGEYT